ncbi:MAG: hypothetical protein LBV69_00480 [Bacteroidales bacterium]|jgi:uncharacterized protein YceK|nr:hypothetical protein [Bacteroidales bacterium]
MNKFWVIFNVIFVVLSGILSVCLFSGCASTKNLYRPIESNEKIIASVQCDFYSMTYLGAGRISKKNKTQAYIELMKEATKKYQGHIDVKNISVAYVQLDVEHGNKFTANGVVVLIEDK